MPAPCCHRSACACSVVECIALILPGGWVGLRARNGAEAWAAVTAVAVLRDATGYSTNPALTWPCSRMAREGRPHVTSGSDAPHSRGNASASK